MYLKNLTHSVCIGIANDIKTRKAHFEQHDLQEDEE